MKKVYYLSTCDTCKQILKAAGIGADTGFIIQNIKIERITGKQLDELKVLAGSYESLFSRKAIKYRELGLKERKLTEKEYRHYILEEYTFLKRPVVIIGDKIFAGGKKKIVDALMTALKS